MYIHIYIYINEYICVHMYTYCVYLKVWYGQVLGHELDMNLIWETWGFVSMVHILVDKW